MLNVKSGRKIPFENGEEMSITGNDYGYWSFRTSWLAEIDIYLNN